MKATSDSITSGLSCIKCQTSLSEAEFLQGVQCSQCLSLLPRSALTRCDRKRPRITDGVQHWLCAWCQSWLPASSFYVDRKSTNGLKSHCKRCHCNISMQTTDIEKARARHAAKGTSPKREKSRIRQGVAVEARALLNQAVETGRIIRPDKCSECGTSGKITGHHDDYSKPLEVVWLCWKCHGVRHRLSEDALKDRAEALRARSESRRSGIDKYTVVEYQDRSQTLGQWCEELSLNFNTIRGRLLRGHAAERAFTQPIKSNKRPCLWRVEYAAEAGGAA